MTARSEHIIERMAFVFACLLLCSCSSAYYGAMERLGYPKRDLMVSRVKDARQSQQEAKEHFRSALERFRSVVRVKGGSLESKYDQLQRELDRSEDKAREVHNRIAAVEDVSEALFSEWKSELRQYKNPELRRRSERSLDETERRYVQLISAMKRAEDKIEPVLQPLRDNVLFLKHNLNARAIAALSDELTEVEANVDRLVSDLEKAVAEADAFITQLNTAAP